MEIREYERLLELYIEVIKKLNGLKLGKPQERQFLDGLVKKLLEHLFAILNLARKPNTVLLNKKYTFSDFHSPSMLVISRAIIETYSVLYHTILSVKPTDRELAQTFFELDSLKRRIQFGVYKDQHIQKQKVEMGKVTQLEAKLDKLKSVHGIFPTKVIEQLENAGLGRQTVYEMYSLFSNYVHGGYLSALQIGQVNERELEEFARKSITWSGIAIALTLIGIGRRFPQARKIVEEKNENANLILMCYSLSSQGDFGDRKGFFENSKTGKCHVLTWLWDVSQGALKHSIKDNVFKNKKEALGAMKSIHYKESYLEYPPHQLIQRISWL